MRTQLDKTCERCGSDDWYLNNTDNSARCAVCISARGKAYRSSPDYERPPRTKEQKRKHELWSKYRITPKDYDEMLERQSGVCAICGTDSPGGRHGEFFHVDHNHKTDEIRGLLCHPCNVGLGHFSDCPNNLRAAAMYLLQDSYLEAQRCFASRPEVMEGITTSIETPIGTAYITVNNHDGKPSEVFAVLGKTGSTERSLVEAIGRMCSLALQHGVPMWVLTKQLRGISSQVATGLGPNRVLSVPDAIGQVLQEAPNGRQASNQNTGGRGSAEAVG